MLVSQPSHLQSSVPAAVPPEQPFRHPRSCFYEDTDSAFGLLHKEKPPQKDVRAPSPLTLAAPGRPGSPLRQPSLNPPLLRPPPLPFPPQGSSGAGGIIPTRWLEKYREQSPVRPQAAPRPRKR